ncbi:MAG: TonB-dependent receptor plug domain-containing protein [Bacteroidetes bacterium]|nr:TonB-dependent receptor plug domain-containing protein [Bacteroidota bacterium]MBU1114659.1 TonB-dependent receptor plug domain-containing protein [Bacteroidota bacterium]
MKMNFLNIIVEGDDKMKKQFAPMLKAILALIFLLSVLPICIYAQGKTIEGMTIEELMNAKVVTGSLTTLTKLKIPVSLTTITTEDIAVTPARNIADLIEIYVPGAIWLNHTSPRIGIRGVIIDRNYKFLMLVNGKNMNQKGMQGAELELSNWDLNDIERIEIIRGPGSVTYGPGAIVGIINIITKTATTSNGVSIGVEDNFAYNSKGGYASLGFTRKDFNLFVHGSLRYTDGYKNADYFAVDQNTGTAGYLNTSDGNGVMPIFGDNLGKPQIKLHFDMNFFDEWRVWARYTNSDQPALFRQKMTLAAGEKVPVWFTGQKGIVGVLENNHSFSENISLKSNISYKSENHYNYWVTKPLLHYDEGGFNSPHGAGNIVSAFSESEIFLSSIINISQRDEKYKYALGASYSYNIYGPGWGNNKMYMLSNDYKIPDGRYIEDIIADGFNTNTISVFSECNFEFHPLANLLLSARMDKNNYSKYFFSPRIGIISEVEKNNIIKLIWQRSVRMNTAEELYKEHLYNTKANPEMLDCIELMYSTLPMGYCLINVSASYNWGEMLGFVYDPATIKGETKPIGNLEYFTAEVEAKFKFEKATYGINHSYVKQISWENATGITSQGISYADYNFNGLVSTGNDLNNWANHSTKLFANVELPYQITLHADGQFFWKWDGYEDVQLMYIAKYGNNNSAWEILNDKLDDENFAGTDVKLNLSISKYFPQFNSTISLYCINLLGSKRYSYSTGERYNYPSRVMWVNESAAFGIKINVNL